MGRKRTSGDLLPRGLYRHGRQYRARRCGGAWVSMGYDREAAVIAYGRWLDAGPRLPIHVSPAAVLAQVRKNAAARGLEVALTRTEVVALLARADGACEVTGLPFSAEKDDGMRMRPWFPSVDRIDGSGGYTFNNCRIVCAYANLALNEFGPEMFARLARAFMRKYPTSRKIATQFRGAVCAND